MIYLDSAATSLQKPPAVGKAMLYALNHMATPGRGLSPPAVAAADMVYRCRSAAAELFGCSDPERVVFTFNATHGLNLAIKSLVRSGDTVLISGYEHNAVTRPLAALGATIKIATSAPFEPETLRYQFEQKLTSEVSCVICTHASNVFGYILPLDEIAALCRERGVPLIVDASQTAGAVPIKFDQWGAEFVAMAGHKALMGPQGTGILLCGDVQSATLLEGGTGSNSKLQEMPDFLPDRLEAGTHNVTGIAGLYEGIKYVQKTTTEAILAHERQLVSRMVYGLERMLGVRVYAAPHLFCQTGVLSFHLYAMDCETVAELLAQQGACLRAGLHCAPLAHNSAGTMGSGTVRASVSPFNTQREIDRFLGFIEDLI